MSAHSTSDKPRSSSSSKSFFGRKLHKDRPADLKLDNSGGGSGGSRPGSSGANGMASASKTSKHAMRDSVQSIDMSSDPDAFGFPAPGIITAIPYDRMSADAKSPVPVDYLPKPEPAPRREPSPHHLIRPGHDFHQYPAINPQSLQNISPMLNSKPVPAPANTTMVTSANGDRGAKYQHWGGATQSYPYSTESSAASRTSLDQNSVYSSMSSATRGSNHLSSDSSFRTYNSSVSAERHPSTQSVPRHTNTPQIGWQGQQNTHPHSSSTSLVADGNLQRPKDDRVIDQMFYDLMIKRGWQNLPDQAKRQMLAYPASKKWTLVHQDHLTQWQGEQKRKQNSRQTHGSADGYSVLGRADEEGSPEWYVKKVLDDTITPKQLGSLSVSLRTQPIR